MFYIIVGGITFLALILLVIAIFYNKFQFAIIKIEESENNTDLFLHKKYDLIKRVCPIIESELKKKKLFSTIEEITNLNHFELNDKLNKLYTDLFKILDDNEKLFKS